jgi:hypothetical protein
MNGITKDIGQENKVNIQGKENAGKYVASVPPYGYLKDRGEHQR